MNDRERRDAPRQLTEKELALLRSHRDRQERYLRTAIFVQSKWFMIAGGAIIALMVVLMYLVSR